MQFDAKISVKQAPVGISRLVICRLEELHPHPSYVRCHLDVSPSQLSTLAELGDLAFRDPIVVTQDKKILDGYARVKLAQLQDRTTLECFQYELTELEALHFLLQRRRRPEGLNDYCRILLALELEPLLSEKARFNQQVGGLKKGSANLTKAERIDVRKQT